MSQGHSPEQLYFGEFAEGYQAIEPSQVALPCLGQCLLHPLWREPLSHQLLGPSFAPGRLQETGRLGCIGGQGDFVASFRSRYEETLPR